MKFDDKAHFNKIGFMASDCYYANDDRANNKKMSMRGGAREVAAQLNDEHNNRME